MPTYNILTHAPETKDFQSRLDWNDSHAEPKMHRVTAGNMMSAINKIGDRRRIVSVEEVAPNPELTYKKISQALFESKIFSDEKGYGDYSNIDFNKIHSSLEYDKSIADFILLLGEALKQTIAPEVNISVHCFCEEKYFTVSKKRNGTPLKTVFNLDFDYLAVSGKTGWDAVVYAAHLILSVYYEQWQDEYHIPITIPVKSDKTPT